VTENDRLSRAPVFVVNLRSIFCRDSTQLSLSFWCWTPCRFIVLRC
jgi:hypothetical protein